MGRMLSRFRPLAMWAAPLAALMLGAAAPAPHGADFSGIWMPNEGVMFDPGARGPAGLPGSTGTRSHPPYTPEYEAIYQKLLADAAAGHPKADPPASCLPPGFPRIMTSPFPLEILQTPGQVTMLHEYMSQVRRIFTDGRGHPDKEDLYPLFNGHSVGKWEGPVLVVDTISLHGDSPFDTTGLPHSDAIHVTERIRLTAPLKMEDQITIDDAKAFTKPWVVTRTYTKKPDFQILQYVCEENNRNPVDKDGNTTTLLPK